MTRTALIPFSPDLAPEIQLTAEINKKSTLFISYRVTGKLDQIALGDRQPKHQRTTGLWNKTCFELFIKSKNGQYLEFNFSPDFEWNAFYFSYPGEKLTPYAPIKNITFDILDSLETFLLIAEIDYRNFPQNFLGEEQEKNWTANISAVIEGPKGLSYWALKHPDLRPNFHHFDSFIYKF